MRSMVILTSLFFNRVGNQSLLETLREYSKYYKIYIITSSSEAETYYRSVSESKVLLNGNIFIFRSPQIFHRFFRFSARFISYFKSFKFINSDNSVDSSFINLKYTFWNIMSFKVSYVILFFYTLFLVAFRRIPIPNLLCAYEIGGVLPVVWLKAVFPKSKTLAKMQGTILYQYVLEGRLNEKSIVLDYQAYNKLKKFDLVTMTNDGTFGDYVLDYFEVKNTNYVFLTNGISRYVIDKRGELTWDYSDSVGTINLISISRLIGWKRVYLSIELMNLLINVHKNLNFNLNIYGYGNLKEVNQLHSLINKYSLEKYVEVLGEVRYEDVPSILMKSDFLLSLYKLTNVTNPLLEAIYLNVPIISICDENLNKIISSDYNKNIFLFSEDVSEEFLVEEIALFLDKCNINRIRSNRRNLFNKNVSVVNSWEERVKIEVSKLEGSKV